MGPYEIRSRLPRGASFRILEMLGGRDFAINLAMSCESLAPNAPNVQWSPSDGSDPKIGGAAGPSSLMVWHVFLRQTDGVKVALMAGSSREIDAATHQEIAGILNRPTPARPAY